jgi:hypothetical protein
LNSKMSWELRFKTKYATEQYLFVAGLQFPFVTFPCAHWYDCVASVTEWTIPKSDRNRTKDTFTTAVSVHTPAT